MFYNDKTCDMLNANVYLFPLFIYSGMYGRFIDALWCMFRL
jgi:hypothetical protein